MAKFIFKMQNILEIKRKLEDQAKSVYADALARLEMEQNKLKRLEEKKDVYENYLIDSMYSVLELKKIKFYEEAVEILKYRIQEQMVNIRDAQLKTERARQALHAAVVERKTYEKLRERAFDTFKKELNAQEQKEIDELVSYTFGAEKRE